MTDTLFSRYPDLAPCADAIAEACRRIGDAYAAGGQLLVCGNGGSASDAEHIVGELMKGFALPRPVPADVRQQLIGAFPDHADYLADHLQGALPTISLVSHTSLMTAFSNDVAADMAFAQQVYGYGRPGDVVWGISTSGNSANVVHALQVGRARGLATVALTGEGGGQMAEIADVAIQVPYADTAEVQERHIAVYHAICRALETRFFGAP